MIVYAVNNIINKTYSKYHIKSNLLIAYSLNKSNINNYLKCSDNILIDSGAFTLLKNNKNNLNFDNYLENYKKFIKKYEKYSNINGFIELDLDKFIGYEKVKNYRKQLFEVSDKIIPVFHHRLGLNEFKNFCKNYNYIAIGGYVVGDIKKDADKLLPFVKYAHKHNTKIHGLGISKETILKKVPFDSVDNSSHLKQQYGEIVLFKNGKYKCIKVNSEDLRKNQSKYEHINTLSSIKFQQYYKKYWEKKEKINHDICNNN